MAAAHNNVLALDVGEVRVGVAIAAHGLSIARPLITLPNDGSLFSRLQDLVKENDIETIVVGLPRGLDSQATKQTEIIEEFVNELKQVADAKVVFQDEALTSVRAKESLEQAGKPFEKSDVDAVAASLILSDYMSETRGS